MVLFCYNNAIQCDPKNIQLHIDRIRVLEEKRDHRRLILAKLMLLKYIDINTELDVYNIYFNQVMSELNNEADISKKIYVLKNDMKKFQANFTVEKLCMLIQLLIKQKHFKESIGIMMSQCKIAASSLESEADLINHPEMFENLNDLQFEIPDTCHNKIRALFNVCLIYLGKKYRGFFKIV